MTNAQPPLWDKSEQRRKSWKARKRKVRRLKDEWRRKKYRRESEGSDSESDRGYDQWATQHLDDLDKDEVTDRLKKIDIGTYIRVRRPRAQGDEWVEGDVMDMRRTRLGAHLYREPDIIRITTPDTPATWITIDIREPIEVILQPQDQSPGENEPEWKQRIRAETSQEGWRVPDEADLMPAEIAWGKTLTASDGREYAWSGSRRRKRKRATLNDSQHRCCLFPAVEPEATAVLEKMNDPNHPQHLTSANMWTHCTVEISTDDEEMPRALGQQGNHQ